MRLVQGETKMPAFFTIKRSFVKDESGAVAIMFGLMFIVLTFVAGMAIDYARINHTKTKFIAAADAAALAGGRALLSGNTEAEAEAIALKFFENNVNAGGSLHASYPTPHIDVDVATGGVSVEVEPVVEMTMTAVLGFDTVTVPVMASTKFDQKDVELGMALDITGSMKGQKIKDLKKAAKKLVEILLPDEERTNSIRIGLAPYSAAINVHDYADTISGGASTDGCVWDRTGVEKYTDAAPADGSYYLAGGTPVDIDPTEGTSSYTCPGSKLLPITNNRSLLEDTIDTYKAEGFTGGHFGAAWAWNLISPQWGAIWPEDSKPAAYGDGKTLKAIILMTDGIFNTAYANDTSSNQAKALCDQMKGTAEDADLMVENHKVVVYAIGFKAPAAAAETLKSCASSEYHYFNAENGDQLEQAFIQIAQQLNNLRLTN